MAASVEEQINYLADRLTEVEGVMIDPVMFGEVKSKVEDLGKRLEKLDEHQREIVKKLDEVLNNMAKVQGGSAVLYKVGSIAMACGGLAAWILQHFWTAFHP